MTGPLRIGIVLAILVELQVAPLRAVVHISREEFMGMMMHGKTFADFPNLDSQAEVMLNEFLWWAETTRAGRRRE